MLESIRNHAQGWIAWVIVGLIIVTFALFGIEQYAQTENTVEVAEVNGDVITGTEFVSLYNRQKQRLQTQFGDMFEQVVKDKDLREQVLNTLIESKVIQQWADSHNMVISNQQLSAVIQSIDVFHKKGKFDEATYESVLQNNGLNKAVFEYDQRQYLLENQVKQLTSSSSFSTSFQTAILAGLQFQERKLNYLRIDQKPLAKLAPVSDKAIAKFYESHKDAYVIPKKVTVDYLLLSQKELAKGIVVTDAKLKEYFDENQDEFTSPEQRKASHILIRVDAPGQEAKALKKIEAIQTKLAAGESFEKLAKANSDDPGSASLGGDLGLFQQGMMVPEFDKAVFSMKVGQVSKPIKTDFGYHLIKLVAIEPKKVKSFAEVKSVVEEQYRLKAAEKKYYDLLEQLNTLTYEQPDTLVPASDVMGIAIKTSTPFARSGGKGQIESNQKVITAAFSEELIKNGNNSSTIELSPTSSVVIRVNTVIPAQQETLADVSADIAKEIQRQAGVKASADLAKGILEKVRAGTSLTDMVKPGVEIKMIGWVNRENRLVLPQITAALFKAPKPLKGKASYVMTTLPTGDSLVIEVEAVKEGVMPTDKAIQNQLKNTSAQIFSEAEIDARIEVLLLEADIQKRAAYLTIK